MHAKPHEGSVARPICSATQEQTREVFSCILTRMVNMLFFT